MLKELNNSKHFLNIFFCIFSRTESGNKSIYLLGYTYFMSDYLNIRFQNPEMLLRMKAFYMNVTEFSNKSKKTKSHSCQNK